MYLQSRPKRRRQEEPALSFGQHQGADLGGGVCSLNPAISCCHSGSLTLIGRRLSDCRIVVSLYQTGTFFRCVIVGTLIALSDKRLRAGWSGRGTHSGLDPIALGG